MAFQIKQPSIDFNQTSIENLFIHDFMPTANGTFVKVYISGFYFSVSNNQTMTNASLAKHLNISIEDVLNAWKFWESKGIIECSSPSAANQHDFDVAFLSIRDMYLQNNFNAQKKEETHTLKSSDKILSAISNPVIKNMLIDIQNLVRRMITPQETNKILDWMIDYKIDPDLMTRAFQITFEDKKIKHKPFSYIQGILVNWYDNRIFTLQELEQHTSNANTPYDFYKKVMQAIGINYHNMPEAHRSYIDYLLEQENYSEDYILYVINEATKRTNNPNLSYIESIFKSIKQTGNTTIEGAKQHFASFVQANQKKTYRKGTQKPKFQNFTESPFKGMSTQDIPEIIKRKANQTD